MNISVNDHNIFLILLVTFLTSLILTPLARTIAIHVNAMDMPNERKVHKIPMPRMGD
jgi:UDP-GlcNAc:undecaprenyl-phosphate GlcNAc-1-phosphate transferase